VCVFRFSVKKKKKKKSRRIFFFALALLSPTTTTTTTKINTKKILVCGEQTHTPVEFEKSVIIIIIV